MSNVERLYTDSQLQDAYNAWVNAKPLYRHAEWFKYCDIRDNVPFGTSQKKYSQIRKGSLGINH
jgi:hypothetical protein